MMKKIQNDVFITTSIYYIEEWRSTTHYNVEEMKINNNKPHLTNNCDQCWSDLVLLHLCPLL